MADEQQIKNIYDSILASHPDDFFNTINKAEMGVGSVLKLLYDADGIVTAGEISKAIGVSTARVAVLLKKMEAKGLISKNQHKDDARVTVVSITDEGRQYIYKIRQNVSNCISALIDEIGEEALLNYIKMSSDIRQILLKNSKM